ncbi:MAG: iron-containing redox enzyme family protein [Crocosphaera sp.]
MNLSSFWTYFDEAKLTEEILINSQFSTIPKWSLEKLQRVSINYRWLVKSHSNHLALMVSRLPESQFKSLISEILNDEQGNGKYQRSHLYLWDNFLRSIEVPDVSNNLIELDPMLPLINNSSIDFVIGLEGVGVECICAVYLEVFEHFLNKHPYVIENKNKIDWEFFDIHVRGEDIHHKQMIREAVEQLISEKVINPDLLLIGYNKAKQIWRDTWNLWLTSSEQEILKVS